MIINRIYETQNLLSLRLFSFLVELSTYQHPCNIYKHARYTQFQDLISTKQNQHFCTSRGRMIMSRSLLIVQ